MKIKYKVHYTWHSGDTFGATMGGYDICEIDEGADMNAWKKDYEDWDMDGSYKSINYMEKLNEDEDI